MRPGEQHAAHVYCCDTTVYVICHTVTLLVTHPRADVSLVDISTVGIVSALEKCVRELSEYVSFGVDTLLVALSNRAWKTARRVCDMHHDIHYTVLVSFGRTECSRL